MARPDHEPRGNVLLEENRKRAVGNLRRYFESGSNGSLRSHQEPVMHGLHRFLDNGNTAGHIILPTGGGKTVVAAEVISVLDASTIIASPTGVILDKTRKTIERFAPDVHVSNFDSRSKAVNGRVINTTLASLDTLANVPAIAQGVELVIADEIHYGTLGKSRHEIWRKFPNALLLGLTATPDFSRLESLQKGNYVGEDERWTDMYTNVIHEMTREEAQEQGVLAPLDIHMVTTNSVMGEVKTVKGEYDEKELDRMLNTEARNIQILALVAGVDTISSSVHLPHEKAAELQKLHESIKGKRTAIFGLNIKHIEILAERLRDVGVRAAAVHNEMPRARQNELLEAHERGEIPVILGVDMLSMGWDSPATEVGIFPRPRRKDTTLIQQVGRLLRTSEDTGKTRAIAIQLVDEYTDQSDRPVLIPEVVDPQYILQSKQVKIRDNAASNGKKDKDNEKELPTITISGMDIETVEDLAMQRINNSKLEAAGTIEEIDYVINDVITAARQKAEGQSLLSFYQEAAALLPVRLDRDINSMVLEAAQSTDTDTEEQRQKKQKAQKAFLFLNMKSILSGVKPYMGDSNDVNEEILHTAITQITERLPSFTMQTPITAQIVNSLQNNETADTAAALEHVPGKMTRYRKLRDVLDPIDHELNGIAAEALPGVTLADRVDIVDFAGEIAADTGFTQDEIADVIDIRSAYMHGTEDFSGPDSTADSVLSDARSEDIDSVLDTLKEREAGVLRLRFGLDGTFGDTATLDDVGDVYGISRERVRQIEKESFRKLRHPSRATLLEGHLSEE